MSVPHEGTAEIDKGRRSIARRHAGKMPAFHSL
jgi:hypothetical protein